MRKTVFLFISLCLAALAQAQVSKTVNLATAGTLSTTLTASELTTVTNLTVTGVMDARDFSTLKSSMTALTSVDLSGVTVVAYQTYSANTIPERAFDGNALLKSIILPNSVTSIGDYAFNFCSNLISTTISNSVVTIGFSAFYECRKLTTINIPNSVTTIDDAAFGSCTSISSIAIPSSVTSIKNGTFDYCSALINVDVNNPNYSSMDGILYNKLQTTLLHTPFPKTGWMNIPNSVTRIETRAFYYSQINSITIPNSVTAIGSLAFWGSIYLSSIKIENPTPANITLEGFIFDGVDKTTCILSVPVGSTDAYKAAAQWKYFSNIEEIIVTDVNTAELPNISATVNQGVLTIANIPSGELATVYNVSGAVISQQPSTGESISVTLSQRGIYVVKAGSQSVKVMYN